MKYSVLLFIFIFLVSCTNSPIKKNKTNYTPYKSSGFALIPSYNLHQNENFYKKIDNDNFEIAHNILKKNSILKITNPFNMKSVELKVTKKIKFSPFYKVLLSKKVADKLELNREMPFVEVIERKKNKSFVAKIATTHTEEKKVKNKAPITQVKIDNISVNKKVNIKKDKKFSIIVGIFYSEISTNELKEILERGYIAEGSLIVKKLGKNKFMLSSKPYTSINTLKNLYFGLNKYGFDDLEIKQHD